MRSARSILRLSVEQIQPGQEGEESTEDLLVTPGHPFYVPGRGFVSVEELQAGDELVSLATRTHLRVRALSLESPQGTTYNLTVEKGHTFFVGGFGTWVHNVGPCDTCPGGACGVGGDAAAAKAVEPDGRFYSVAFETTLDSSSYPGVTRYMHFKEANIALDSAIRADAGMAANMEKLGVSIPRSLSGAITGKSPENWVWHHERKIGVMHLVPKIQHPNIPGGIFWETMHPDGKGGFSIWGK